MNKQLVVWFVGNKPEKRFTDKHWKWFLSESYTRVAKKDGTKEIYIPDSNVLYFEIERVEDES